MLNIFVWEQRKLGTYIIQNKVKNKNNENYKTYSITNKYGFVPQNEQFGQNNTYSKSDKTNNYIVQPESFGYNPARINVGSIGFWSGTHSIIVSSLYEIFTTKKGLENNFLLQWFRTSNFQRQIKKLQEGGVRQYFFFDKMQKTIISLPSNSEQILISKVINQISILLSLQQRKLKLLKQLKKAMLQQMFADKDSKTPTLRFKGFSEDWMQQKGKNLFISKTNKGFPKLTILSATQDKGMIPRSDSGIDIKSNKKNLNEYKKVEPGDFIIHLRSFQGGFAFSKLTGIVSPAYTVFSFKQPEKFDNLFWKEKFTSYNFIQLLKKVTYGVRDGRSISYSDFLTLNENFPKKNEQSKIGYLLQQFEKTNFIQQSKINEYQKIKTFFLQNMFI